MKKNYTKKTFATYNLNRWFVLAFLCLSTVLSGYSQVIVPFTPRTSSATPATTIYNVKGDFSMIGNTNLTSVNYTTNSSNNSAMRYVDIDGNPNTLNSSSATLTLDSENGSFPECSKILYAGLYWTGSAGNSNRFFCD